MPYIQLALKQYVQETLCAVINKAFKINSKGNIDVKANTEFPKSLTSYPIIVVGDVVGDSYRFIGEPYLAQTTSVSSSVIDGITTTITDVVEQGGFFNLRTSISIAGRTTAERRTVRDLITIFLRDLYKNELAKEGLTLVDLSFGNGKTEKIGNEYIYFDSLNVIYFVKGWKENLNRLQGDFGLIESLIKEMIIIADGSCSSF